MTLLLYYWLVLSGDSSFSEVFSFCYLFWKVTNRIWHFYFILPMTGFLFFIMAN
ncbi:hypothetical protein BDQ17DRAFT_1367502 [Cyathus striatus]|nr:hypothetical protein BDQ17DRAFT_1367502 [Cyathus striatus]